MLTLQIAAAALLFSLIFAAAVSRAHAPTPVPMRDCNILTRRQSRVSAIHDSDYTAQELRDRADVHRRIVREGSGITFEALRAARLHLEQAELLSDLAACRDLETRIRHAHSDALRDRRGVRPIVRLVGA
ncbi:hypothetical protein [Deinococcus aquaticus]|uniref:hypothetical protein n=1 Tax=Deinococcus aquaticus TaxID=328692 RepID=UPI003F46A143